MSDSMHPIRMHPAVFSGAGPAVSVHAASASAVTDYYWEAYAGARDDMTADGTDPDDSVSITSTNPDLWIATGCQTLDGHICCHEEDAIYLALRLTSYQGSLGQQLGSG